MKLVKTSYNKNDCVVLLKELSDCMTEMPTAEREELIQSGVHYSEMLPEEKEPSAEYMEVFARLMINNSEKTALYISKLADMAVDIVKETGKPPIILSLARAGMPIGVLLKRYLTMYKGIIWNNQEVPHYAISIIRDKGIDINAMNYVYDEEVLKNNNIVNNIIFVDGWTGKGMIRMQLDEAVEELHRADKIKWGALQSRLFVVADPANITKYRGTCSDFMLPSACLNSTISGLTSRTILNKYVDVSKGDFHGATYFDKFEGIDKTNEFIDNVTGYFSKYSKKENLDAEYITETGMETTLNICRRYNIGDFKKVKPGVGETTRVLLRRVPWLVLINKGLSKKDLDIQHILLLCKEKGIKTAEYDLGNYKVCGIIKELSADA